MTQFFVTIEGTLTSSPRTEHTRGGYEYAQFTIIHRVTYSDRGKRVDAEPMYFDVICWKTLAGRARNLKRGDTVVVEASRLMPYDNAGVLGMKMTARNLSISMRHGDAHAGSAARQRSGDLVTTPHGETIAVDKYPDVIGDLELVHHG